MSYREPDPTEGAKRKVRVTLESSDTSRFVIRWDIDNYIRRGDAVVLLYVSLNRFPLLSSAIVRDLENAPTLFLDAHIPYAIHKVDVEEKDRKKLMGEPVCLELGKLGLNAVIMCAQNTNCDGVGLGRVSGYCTQNCICPVVLVRQPQVSDVSEGSGTTKKVSEGYDTIKKVLKGRAITEEERKRLEEAASKLYEVQKRKGGSGGGFSAKRST